MRCPRCEERAYVDGTIDQGPVVLRYRYCPSCGHRWKTYEDREDAPVRKRRPSAPPAPETGDLFAYAKQSAKAAQ